MAQIPAHELDLIPDFVKNERKRLRFYLPLVLSPVEGSYHPLARRPRVYCRVGSMSMLVN